MLFACRQRDRWCAVTHFHALTVAGGWFAWGAVRPAAFADANADALLRCRRLLWCRRRCGVAGDSVVSPRRCGVAGDAVVSPRCCGVAGAAVVSPASVVPLLLHHSHGFDAFSITRRFTVCLGRYAQRYAAAVTATR